MLTCMCAGSLDEDGFLAAAGDQMQEGQPLPGIPTTWVVNQSVPEVGMLRFTAFDDKLQHFYSIYSIL